MNANRMIKTKLVVAKHFIIVLINLPQICIARLSYCLKLRYLA